MGSRLATRSTTYVPAEDHSWLGSAHGTQECDSITLDHTQFASFNGLVPSGVVLAKNVAGTKYVPFATAAGDATGVAVGHLFTTTVMPTDQDVSAPLYWHGEVIIAKLPTGSGYDSTVKADLPQIRYV